MRGRLHGLACPIAPAESDEIDSAMLRPQVEDATCSD